jgi:Subtilase family
VVVVLADQLSSTPPDSAHLSARKSHAHADQSAVLSSLAGPAPTDVKYFTLGNAFSATVTVDQATALAANPAVASVSPDANIALAPAAPATTTPDSTVTPNFTFVKPKPAPTPVVTGVPTVPPAICSTNPKKPELEPEALSTINARSDDPNAKTAASLGIDGSGVTVAIIADGLDPNQAGFIRKNGTSSIVDYQDFYGDGLNAPTGGAEAFGDASTISAQGNVVYDVADFANPAVVNFKGGHCYIKVVGVAPGANVVALKAGSELLPDSSILQAIDYAVTVDHVDVINESFGGNVYPDSSSRNGIETFDDEAVAAGVTVTVSSGDSAPTSTIGSPATDPNVISAGASTDARVYEQTGYALATAFGNGTWLDNNISALSSSGITQNGRTIDLVAPGEADWALCDNNGNFDECTNYAGTGFSNLQEFGGTSQSSPMTAGVAALVIQAFRKAHNGNSPTPAVVKQIITSTTRDLGFPGDEQGTGLLDARAAVEAALTYPGGSGSFNGKNSSGNNSNNHGNNSNGISSNVVFSTDQLTLEGAPGTTQTGQVQVQNVGTSRVTVSPSTRTYVNLATSTQTADIDAASTQTTPYPTTGAPWAYKKVTFSVPNGTDVLSAAIVWNSETPVNADGPVVRMSLFSPSGAYAANTRPQGGPEPANYGENDIREPQAGTWTAVLYTPQTGGFTGPVTLQAISKRAVPIGSISPSQFSLQPGQSRTVTVSLPTPSTGGDAAYTVSIGSSGGHQTAIPVIMRAIVPTSHGTGIFTGTITGGNARGAPAQTFSYAFDVPSNQNDLDVSVTLANDPGDLLEGFLIDPSDETPSIGTNADADGSGTTDLSMTDTVANPAPGRWRYVVVVENPVSGNELTENFTGTVAFNTQQVSVSTTKGTQNLIDGGRATLKFGKATTATLLVKNTSPAAIAVQTDARTDDQIQVQLAPQFAGSTIPLPIDVSDLADIPAYLVPPDTSRLAVTSSSTVPAQMELSSPGGGLDLFGNLQQAQDGSTLSTATDKEISPEFVGEGFWFPYVDEIGPFGVNGAPAASTSLVANATTAGFDSTITTSTGDPFLSAVDPTADFGTPLLIQPGATGAITITITPTAKKGSTVKGVLNIVTTPSGTPLFDTTGDVLLAVPYTYTVGAAASSLAVPVSSPPVSSPPVSSPSGS